MVQKENLYGVEFKGVLDTIVKSGDIMVDLITKACYGDVNDVIPGLVDKLIANEDLVDNSKEIFIEKIFIKKQYLSNYSKIDNHFIIRKLDHIADQIEVVARMFDIYTFQFPRNIPEKVVELSKKVNKVIKLTMRTVENFYSNLPLARRAINEVEDARVEAREVEFDVLKALFEIITLQLDSSRLFMIKSLVENLSKISDIAEEFCDDLDAIVLQYMYPKKEKKV